MILTNATRSNGQFPSPKALLPTSAWVHERHSQPHTIEIAMPRTLLLILSSFLALHAAAQPTDSKPSATTGEQCNGGTAVERAKVGETALIWDCSNLFQLPPQYRMRRTRPLFRLSPSKEQRLPRNYRVMSPTGHFRPTNPELPLAHFRLAPKADFPPLPR
jgi:hypothetical protein